MPKTSRNQKITRTCAVFCRMRLIGDDVSSLFPQRRFDDSGNRDSNGPRFSTDASRSDAEGRCLVADEGSPPWEFFEHPERLPADPTAQKKIRFVAKRFLRIYDWYPDSLEDVEQACWLALWKQFRNFDPARASWGTFVRRLAVSKCKDLRKFHRRKKRRATQRQWLEDNVPPGDEGEELSVEEVLDREVHHRRRFKRHFLTEFDRVDLQDAIDHLSPGLRKLAMLLQVYNYRETRETLALSRGRLKNDISALGQVLKQAGVEPLS